MHMLFLTTCCAILLSLHDAAAMVIGESLSQMIPSKIIPSRRPDSLVPPNGAVKRFRLRRTSSSDLDAICTMLAKESVRSNHFLHRIRAKASFNEQLSHRLQAIDVGRKTYSYLKQLDDEGSLLDHYYMSYLLSVNAEFKTMIKRAVNTASEPNAWEEYHFDPTTQDSSLLHHVMVTMEDRCSGDVVGFCEIGYLQQLQRTSEERMNVSDDSLEIPHMPEIDNTVNFSCVDTSKYAPAIFNLVVSPSHRRLGLASRLVNFAQKYTRTQLWQQDYNVKLGLYVHPDNHSAVNLYTRKGFEVVTESKEGLLYMTV
jgi:ribosomal protein S18 acetylase RimI-like enzyme